MKEERRAPPNTGREKTGRRFGPVSRNRPARWPVFSRGAGYNRTAPGEPKRGVTKQEERGLWHLREKAGFLGYLPWGALGIKTEIWRGLEGFLRGFGRFCARCGVVCRVPIEKEVN